MEKHILAGFDHEGVYVYQAFSPPIVAAALAAGTFDAGFSLERMTWIKPSLGWMLHRSGHATKARQEAILRIKVSREGFDEILSQALGTSYRDDGRFEDEHAWRRALKRGCVRYQWDPDRALCGRRLERRAIQLGIRGEVVRRYVSDWIIGLEEVTDLARAIQAARAAGRPLPAVPEEGVYPLDARLRAILDADPAPDEATAAPRGPTPR